MGSSLSTILLNTYVQSLYPNNLTMRNVITLLFVICSMVYGRNIDKTTELQDALNDDQEFDKTFGRFRRDSDDEGSEDEDDDEDEEKAVTIPDGIDPASVFEESSKKCQTAFQTHPYANCILYTDEDCTSGEPGETTPINRAISYVSLGV